MPIKKDNKLKDYKLLTIDKTVSAHGFILCYNDQAHKYWIIHPDGSKHDVYGMTTIQKPIGSVSFDKDGKVSSKSDILMKWAVKVNREAMIDHVNQGKELSIPDIKELSGAYNLKSDYAKDFGKIVHNLIESATNSNQSGDGFVWNDSPEHLVAKRVIDNDRATGTHVIAQELLVFAPSNPQDPPEEWRDWMAGQFDRLVLRDGQIELQDHKTSSGVYDLNYFAQCMGYQQMLEWMMKDKNNTYCETLSTLYDKPIAARRVNLATKTGEFTDKWVSTNELDDRRMLQATLEVFNISKKYRHLFW